MSPKTPDKPDKSVSRRNFLKGVGLASLAGTAAAVASPVQSAPAPPSTTSRTVAPAQRAYSDPSRPPMAVQAYTKLTFGHRPGELETFEPRGFTDLARLTNFVDEQLNPDLNDDPVLAQKLAAANFESLNKSLPQLWLDHHVNPEDKPYPNRQIPFRETREATFLRAVYSKWQLHEVVVDFWHNHFNVRGPERIIESVMVHYDRDVIRPHVFGNFRTMLQAVATSPAMLYYLDNYLNSDGGPNENFARELFELHTLGAENYLGAGLLQSDVPGYPDNPVGYVDADVYEAARAFTGWRVRDESNNAEIGDTGEFFFYNEWHDRFQKTVLGQFLAADPGPMAHGNAVLDRLAQHPGTGRYICRKLCRRFISDTPPDALVNEAAEIFTQNWQAPDQIKQVLRHILLSSEFRTTWGQKMKRPFEYAVSALRTTNADYNDYDQIDRDYEPIGQPLFEWGPPTGYPDVREYWQSTVSMLQRWRFGIFLLDSWDDDDNNHYIDTVGQTPAEAVTANQIVDFWVNQILGRPLADTTAREDLADFVADGRNPDSEIPTSDEDLPHRIRTLVSSLLNSPDFQWR